MKRVIYLAAVLVVGSALPVSSVGAVDQAQPASFGGSQASPSMTIQATHDIAVIGIQSSTLAVTQGDLVNIDVTAENRGTATETFDLTLRDETVQQDIQTVTLTLDAGQTVTVGLQWNTLQASPEDHFLTALAVAPGDQVPGNDSLTLSSPISVAAVQITFDPLALPDATFGEGEALQAPAVTTAATPGATVFLGVHDASHYGALVRPAVGTRGMPHQSIFVVNADATFQPGSGLQDPFRQGEVLGTLRLEGQQSSLGAYVQLGESTHFVQSDGSFRIMSPSGSFDILLDSPGHVPVRIANAPINPGEVLTLPELTLPFGDANGDGKIDILDLSMAASNFGDTVVDVPAP